MNQYHSISPSQIKRLDSSQLVELLSHLLVEESRNLETVDFEIRVSSNQSAGDGGEDGFIKWSDGVSRTRKLPKRHICFQSKAKPMGIPACKKEITIGGKGKEIQPQIAEAIKANGAYIVFCNQEELARKAKKGGVEGRKKAIFDEIRQFEPNVEIDQIDFYDATEIAVWVNQFYPVVRWVRSKLELQQGFWQPWEDITPNISGSNGVGFIPNDFNQRLIQEIRNIQKSRNRTIRIDGLPGLGKTRIVKEALGFADATNIGGLSLKELAMFRDLHGSEDKDIAKEIQDLQKTEVGYVFVLDNCPLTVHEDIQRLFRIGKDALLTIGHETNERRGVDHGRFEIRAAYCKDMIRLLIDAHSPSLPEEYKETIERIADGYPYFAELIIERLRSRPDPSEIDIGDIEKRIFQRLTDPYSESITKNTAIRVLTALSLFAKVGYIDDYKEQFEFLTGENGLCHGVSFEDAQQVVEHYAKKGIIEKSGRFISIKPKPLAIHMAISWWEDIEDSSINQRLNLFSDADLLDSFCEQTEYMGSSHRAKAIVENLCGGASSPLSSAEGLKSRIGSRLFSSFTVVNPQACAKAIFSAFGSGFPESFDGLEPSNRSRLVRGLERLLFGKETFELAAKTLLAFAANETEHVYANNSTHAFLKSFGVYLAGTEADLQARKRIFEFALNSGNLDFQLLAVQALDKSYSTEFQHWSGAEFRGGDPPFENYRPSIPEIREYWTWGSAQWLRILRDFPNLENVALNAIASKIGTAQESGAATILQPVWEAIAESHGDQWSQGRKEIDFILDLYRDLDDDSRGVLQDLYQKLAPKDKSSRIQAIISEGMNKQRKRGKDDPNPELELVKELSLELSAGDEWLEHLELLFRPTQRWAYYLGTTLAKNWKGDWSIAFEAISSNLRNSNIGKPNLDLVKGIFSGLESSKLAWAFLVSLSVLESIKRQVVSLAANLKPSIQGLKEMLIWIEEGRIDSSDMLAFLYTEGWDKVVEDDIILFLGSFSKLGDKERWLSLDLLDGIIFQNKKSNSQLIPFGLGLYVKPGITLIARRFSDMGGSWKRWAELLLTDKPQEGIHFLANEVSSYYAQSNHSQNFDPVVEEINARLLKDHFDTAWPIVAIGFTGQVSSIDRILRLSEDDYLPHQGPVFNENASTVIEWCKNQPSKAVARIAGKMPLSLPSRPSEWHPFAIKVIDCFGRDGEVRRAISSSLHSSWIGSPFAKFYEARKALVDKLLTHQFPEIREWASEESKRFAEEVRTAKLQDEEHRR